MKSMNPVYFTLLGAGAAALLSFVIGIANGLSPVGILVRASFMALGTGGFIIVSRWLIRRFLPELQQNPRDGENPDSPGPGTGFPDNSREEGRKQVDIVLDDAFPVSPKDSEGENEDGLSNLTGNKEEIAGMTESVHNEGASGMKGDTGASRDDLDILSGLDYLDDSKDNPDTADEGSQGIGSVLLSSEASPGARDIDIGEFTDPKEIAKAVKTLLKKDKY